MELLPLLISGGKKETNKKFDEKYDVPVEEHESRGGKVRVYNFDSYPVKKLNERVFEEERKHSLMSHPFFFVLLGPSRAGKTTAWLNLLTNPKLFKGFFDRIYYFIPTWYEDDIYETVLEVDDDDVFTEFNLDEIERILSEQKEKKEDRKILFIIDDALAAEGALKISSEKAIHKLATTGRKYNASVIYSTQNMKQCINPIVRENMTDFAMFFSNNEEEKKKAFKEIRGSNSVKEVEALYDACFTGPGHSFLYVQMNNQNPLTRYRKNFGDPLVLMKKSK